MSEWSVEKVTDKAADQAGGTAKKLFKKPWMIAAGVGGLLLVMLLRARSGPQAVEFASYPKAPTEDPIATNPPPGITPDDLQQVVDSNVVALQQFQAYVDDQFVKQSSEFQKQLIEAQIEKQSSSAGTPIASSGSSSKATPTEHDYTIGKGVVTGDAAKANVEKLKSSSAFRDSEIKRAESVIAYRKSQGMDTSAQEKYLKDVKTMR